MHSRYAWRSHRTEAAIDSEQGLLLVTIEQLAARLAGGFLQSISADDLKAAVVTAIRDPLGELDKIKTLPGFQRAAAASLSKLWTAGLNLVEEEAAGTDETAKARFASLSGPGKRSDFSAAEPPGPATGPRSGSIPTCPAIPGQSSVALRSTAAPRCHQCGGYYCR